MDKIFSDTSASQYRFTILVALIILTLLSVSYVIALDASIDQPADGQDWGNEIPLLNISTDFNANCSYNISDQAGTDIIGSLGSNDTQEHVANNIDITSLPEGAFVIQGYCYNSTDGVLDITDINANKDTSGVDVLSWNEPDDGWTVQNGTTMMINITVNFSDTSALNQTKLDVFDVSDCVGGSVSNAEYDDQGPDGVYVNATWSVPSAVDASCDIVANLSTGGPQNIWNTSTITVSVHPDCGSEIKGDFTMVSDIEECQGVGYNITTSGVTLDCDGHSIMGTNDTDSVGINIDSSVTGVTIQNCIISNFTEGIFMETGSNTITGNTIENTTDALLIEGASLGNIVVSENSIKYSTTGILLIDLNIGANINITNNTITNNDYGIDAQNVDSAGSYMVQIFYNDIHSNSLFDFAGDSSDSNAVALNYCVMGDCYGNYWGVSDHCPYFRQDNTNTSYDDNGYWDGSAYSSSRVGNALEEPNECIICGETIEWDEELDSDVYNRTGGDTCYGDFAIELTADDAMIDCQGYTIKGSGTGIGVNVSNVSVTNITIKNCNIIGFGEGIHMENNESYILDNNITDNVYGIVIEDEGSFSIIERNIINESSTTGILLQDLIVGAHMNITNNTITDNTNGIDAQNVDSFGGQVMIWYNDFENSGYDLLADSSDSDGIAMNYCPGGEYCYGNFWGVSDHCPYFRQDNTNTSYDDNGYWDGSAYSSSRVGNALEEPNECIICGETIEWDEELDSDVYNRTGGDTCYGDFAIELTQSDSALDCQGYTIKGSGSGMGIILPNITANNITVKNCVISGFTGGTNAAINISGGDNHTFYNNTIFDGSFGIRKVRPQADYDYNITGNTIYSLTNTGIYLNIVVEMLIEDNYIHDCAANGMQLWSSGTGEVLNNRINNSGTAVYMNIGNGAYYNFEGNSINDSTIGLRLRNVGIAVNITDNDFYDNTYGIQFDGTTTLNNKFVWHNNILDSVSYGISAGDDLEVSNGTHGNFWGNATCPVFVAGVHSNASGVIDSFPYNATDAWDSDDPAPSCTIPTVELVTPAMDDVRMFNAFNFTVNVTDVVNVQSVTIWNGTAHQPMALTEGTATDGRWSAVVYLNGFSDGVNDVNISATNGGQANDTEYFSVIVDNTAPTVTLEYPENHTNISDAGDEYEFSAWDALYNDTQMMNCSVYLYNSTNHIVGMYNNNTMDNDTTTITTTLNFASGEGNYSWNVTCYDMAMTNLDLSAEGNAGYSSTYNIHFDATPPTPGTPTIGEPDTFVSGYHPNNNITVILSATDVGGTGVKNITANFSEITEDPADVYVMQSNGTHWNYTFTIDRADMDDMDFEDENVTFTVTDYAGNTQSSAYATLVFYNLTVPLSDDDCIRYGFGTTNFSEEQDMADVDFTVVVDWNYSLVCGYMGPAADNNYHKVAKINFTGLDLSSPSAGPKLGQLEDAIDISITPDGNFGNSRVYVNSTYFEELNTTATIALYNLPFDDVPDLSGDFGAAGVNSTTTYLSYEHPTFGVVGNWTFNVNGFSGYNLSDIVDPIITVNAPTPNLTTVGGTAPTINVTVNGTGTQVSNLTIIVNGTYYYMDGMTCFNATGAEDMTCYFNPTVADGNHQLNIIARDYGGTTGNGATEVWNFTTDSSRPFVTNNQTNSSGTIRSTDSVLLNVTATDSSNVTNVTAGVAGNLLMGNHTASNYNLTTTPAALGCGQGWCTVYFNATDYFGNYNDSVTVKLFVDDAGPVVTGVSVTNATNVTSAVAVNIQATVTDVSGVASVVANGNTMYLLSGNIYHANLTAGDLGCSSDAVCPITINATDTLGNYNDTETTSYYVDDTNPAVTLPSAVPTEVKSASALYIGVAVSDVSNVTSVVSNNSVALTKGATTWNVTTTAADLGCAANAVCTIGFTATDMAGNANNSVVTTVIVDDTAPVVTFVYNNSDLNSSANDFTLNITVDEINTNASVTANGNNSMVHQSGNVWSVTASGYELGCATTTSACTITFSATDGAGNIGTDTTTLTIDNDGPAVTGLAVNDTKIKRTGDINVRVTVTDTYSSVPSVTAGMPTQRAMSNIGGNIWEINASLSHLGVEADGDVTLRITATDALGNVNNTVTTVVTVDSVAPVNTSAFTHGTPGSSSATVTSTFGEDVKCTVIYGTNESVMGTTVTSASFSSTGAVAITGLSASTTYYYNVTDCVDEAGNSGGLAAVFGPFNFTTSATAPAGGGGGGGGGGSYTVSSTLEVGDLTGAVSELELGRGDTMSFSHNNEPHSVEVDGLGSNYAEFIVMSEPQLFRLFIGQSKDVDIDGDFKGDINVKLLDIISSKALVSVTSLLVKDRETIKLLPPAKRTPKVEPELVDVAPETESAPIEPAPVAEPEAAPAPAPEQVVTDSATPWYWYAFGALIAIIVIAIVVMAVIEKRKRSQFL